MAPIFEGQGEALSRQLQVSDSCLCRRIAANFDDISVTIAGECDKEMTQYDRSRAEILHLLARNPKKKKRTGDHPGRLNVA